MPQNFIKPVQKICVYFRYNEEEFVNFIFNSNIDKPIFRQEEILQYFRPRIDCNLLVNWFPGNYLWLAGRIYFACRQSLTTSVEPIIINPARLLTPRHHQITQNLYESFLCLLSGLILQTAGKKKFTNFVEKLENFWLGEKWLKLDFKTR